MLPVLITVVEATQLKLLLLITTLGMLSHLQKNIGMMI